MKCINCGADIPDNADRCTNCGTQQEFNQTLIDRAKNGDTQAETKLYNATYNNVYALIRSMVKDEDTVLDLLQDSYVKAFRNLGQLQEANKFRPWLKTIARNRTMDYFREHKTVLFSEMTPLDDEDTEVEFEDTNPETMPDVVIDRQETARLLGEILDTLPDGQRSVLSMHYYEQMSVKEIAAALDMNQNTVLTNLRSGRKKVEKKVLDLEKRGTRIYGLAPIPFLLLLLRKNEAHAMDPGSAASSLTKILQQTGNAAGTAAQEASVRAAKSAAREAAQMGAQSIAAATAAKAGIPLTAKIIAAVAAVAVVGIGAAVVIPAISGSDSPRSGISATVAVSENTGIAAAENAGNNAETVFVTEEEGPVVELTAAEREEAGRSSAEQIWGTTPVTEYVSHGVHFYMPSEYPLEVYTEHEENGNTLVVYGWESNDINEVKNQPWLFAVYIRTREEKVKSRDREARSYVGKDFYLGSVDGIAYSIDSHYGILDGARYYLITDVTVNNQPTTPPDYMLEFPYDKVMESAWIGSPDDVIEESDTMAMSDYMNLTVGEVLDLLGDDYEVDSPAGGLAAFYHSPDHTIMVMPDEDPAAWNYDLWNDFYNGYKDYGIRYLSFYYENSEAANEVFPGVHLVGKPWAEVKEQLEDAGIRTKEPESFRDELSETTEYSTFFQYQGITIRLEWDGDPEAPITYVLLTKE